MTTWRALFVGRRGFAKVTPGAPTCQVNGRQTTLAKPCAGRRVVEERPRLLYNTSMYAPILRNLPDDMRMPMLELVEAIEQNMRAELAARREDFDTLQATVAELAAAQARTEQRVEELAAAQARTEQRVEELAAAQARTEQRVEELAAAQARTETALSALTQRVDALAAAQARTEQRVEEMAAAQARTETALNALSERVDTLAAALNALTERVDALAAALSALTERVDALAAAQARTEERLDALIVRVDRMDIHLNELRGDNLERRYRERAFGYFGRLLRRVRVVDLYDIEPQLEERLSADALDDLRQIDLIVRGRHKERADLDDLWLAVEVSTVVDRSDVERARRRAAALRTAGYKAVAVVAGHDRTADAADRAAEAQAVVFQNGSIDNWDSALSQVEG